MEAVFHHIVLLRFQTASTADQHQTIADALRALPSVIDEILTYDVNIDAGLSAENAHVSVHGTFVDEMAWRTYSSHRAHLAVLDGMIKPILASAVRTQYTT